MYCVIGEKILKCEVSEKLENYSWVRIGKTEKGQTIPNNRIFETDEAARQFIKNRDERKASKDKDMTDEINDCKRLYADFQKETGIMVRIIDRRFKRIEVERQLAHLRKKYNKSEDAQSGTKAPKDSRAYSTKPSSSFKTKSEPTDGPEHKFGKSSFKPKSNFDRKPTGKSSDRSTGNPNGKSTGKFSGKSTGKSTGKFSGKSNARSSK